MNHKLRVKILIFTSVTFNFLTIFGVVIHRNGPHHKEMATNCLEEIIKEHFHFSYGKSDENHTLLFTIVLTENITSPAYEIQENIIKIIHNLAKWFQVEAISSKTIHNFESFTECSEAEEEDGDPCENNFVIDFKSSFYIIIVDSETNFDNSMEVVQNSKTFNPMGLYLVYVENKLVEYEEVAENILKKMWNGFMRKTAVLLPETLQTFNLYRLNVETKGPFHCGSNITLIKVDHCQKGHMAEVKKRYYFDKIPDYRNCSIGVITKPFKPFVINAHQGFEIDVLKTIGRNLNIHFNITFSQNVADTWGSKDPNGKWTGKLKLVYDHYYIGIGNIQVGMPEAGTDFYFTRYYHMEPLVFVVPIAEYVPKWRVLLAIFTPQMWGVCLGVIFGFGLSFYAMSKLGKELRDYRLLGRSFLTSFQMFMTSAAYQQPISDLTRVFFLSMAIFSIIISSAYTCSLVYYLTNPIREHQPTKNTELVDVFGNLKYGVGGIYRYKKLFNVSENPGAYKIFEIYQTARGANDTILYWINKVGTNRNIWTISSRLFANYLISQNHSIATFPNGKPKIFVFKNQLISYSVSMLMRKGHPILNRVDQVIKKLCYGGIVEHLARKYTQAIHSYDNANEEGDDVFAALTIDHLQGAFALLVLGCLLGFASFFGEFVVGKVRHRKRKVRMIKKRNAVGIKKGTVAKPEVKDGLIK